MIIHFNRFLRPLHINDHEDVRVIYSDAIETQGDIFYTSDQIKSWSALAWLPGILDKPLLKGKGWISFENNQVAAFAVRYPLNRLALLYSKGCFARRGHATELIGCIEEEARLEGISILITEASFFSYPLLLRLGWKFISMQRIQIGGINFDRYLMEKVL